MLDACSTAPSRRIVKIEAMRWQPEYRGMGKQDPLKSRLPEQGLNIWSPAVNQTAIWTIYS